MITRSVVFVVLAIVVIYGLFEARPLLSGPSLDVSAPVDGEVIADGMVTITGESARVTSLTLNGMPLLPDQQGQFIATLAFPKGTSILTFVAQDRFNRTVTATRTIYVP